MAERKVLSISSLRSQQRRVLHIAFGIDAEFAPPMGIAITSIAENNPSLNLAFHVFAEAIKPADLERLTRLERQYGHPITVHQIVPGTSRLARLPKPPRLPAAVYNRLLICETLVDVAERVLYLDADLVCLGSIGMLRELDLTGCIVAAVEDFAQEERKSGLPWPGDTPYFNSGVLLIDIAAWNDHHITRRVIEKILAFDGKRLLPEQDAINLAVEGRVHFLDRAWNLLRDIYPPGPETRFLHFAGNNKPWQPWSPTHGDAAFAQYQRLSPWAGWQFRPRARKHRKKLAQYHLRQKDLANAALWGIRYLLSPR